MAGITHRFTATHGVSFSEDGVNHWALFEEVQTGDGRKVYAFETSDAKVAERLRKVAASDDSYGIAEAKRSKAAEA